MNDRIDQFKKEAAEYAVTFVESGMVVGLGTGSTAILAVQRLAKLLHTARLQHIVCIPTSEAIAKEAQRLGIPLTTLEEQSTIDLTIDGADETDPNLDLIKGGGGALLREKIVAQASRRELIIVDESKPSPMLGTKWAVPIEVIPFGWGSQREFLESLGATVRLRMQPDDELFKTDHGNLILDCDFGPLENPRGLAQQLDRRVGIVEHGLFLGMVTDLVVAGSEGIEHFQQGESSRVC